MKRWLLILMLISLTTCLSAATTIIPTDNSQANLRDAYRLVLKKAAHPWTKNGQVDGILDLGKPYFGEVPVIWSVDFNNEPGSFLIPDTMTAPAITMKSASFPALEKAFSLSFSEDEVTIFVLKSAIKDSLTGTATWEYLYFENFLVNTLNLKRNQHYIFVDESEFTRQVLEEQFSYRIGKILIIPAFQTGGTSAGYFMDMSIQKYPQFATAMRTFLQNGGTIYTEGNAAYLLEAATILADGTVDLGAIIDGKPNDMLANVQSGYDAIPPGHSNQLYTAQAPTIRDSVHAVATFSDVADADDIGKPALLYIEDDALVGNGRIIVNVGMPAVGAMIVKTNPQWQWLANAIFLAFSERMDVVRSVVVVTDSLHPEPNSLPLGIETTFEVTLQIHNFWNSSSGDIQISEQIKPYFDFVDVTTGQSASHDPTTNRVVFTLSGISGNSKEIISYRLRAPDIEDERVGRIDEYLDDEINMKISAAEFSYGDPIYNQKIRMMTRDDLWVRFLFEARIVADLDLNWKNILGHKYQPFKIFTTMENKERTEAVNTEIVHYVPLDVPVYKTQNPLIPIEKTPPGQLMDLLRLGHDLDGDKATDGPDVGFAINSIFPDAASVDSVRVYWRNPWTGEFDDYDFDRIVPVDADSDGVFEIEDEGDKIRALRILWKPGLHTETEGMIPGYQFYDPFCYWEIWIDPPDEVQMAIGAVKKDTVRFHITNRIQELESFYYEHWERWMEHDSSGTLMLTRLIKRHHQDYEGFAMVDSSYDLKPDDMDYGWIPKPIRNSVFFLALGGRGPSMTNPETEYSEQSKITYQTLWRHAKEIPLRCAYTYYVPLPNPLQFEYISKTFQITDPMTGGRIYELPANRSAELTFDISISTEYSLYWINAMTPDNDGNGIGDGIYSYVIEQIPKGMGGYHIDLPRTTDGQIDTFAVADPAPTAIWEEPFYWKIYWNGLRIPAALDDDNGDGIDDWLDDRGDRFYNKEEQAYFYDAFPPDSGQWLSGPDGEYGDDFCEALGVKRLKVFAKFDGGGREGSLKINDGAWLVNEEIFGGPPWVQFSHVQEAWAVGHNIHIEGKPDPTFTNLHANPVYEKFYITDEAEPHQFDVLFAPWVKSYGDETATATTYMGERDPCHQVSPDAEMPAQVNRNQKQTLTFFPGVDPNDFQGYPKTGSGLFVQAIVELNNNGDDQPVLNHNNEEIGRCAKTHWYDVKVAPNLVGLGNSEIFASYCAYPRPLVPNDDFRTLKAGWRFNPSTLEILIKMGNTDGSASIPEIQSSRRGYYVFTFKIDEFLADGCYQIPFILDGFARDYNDPGTQIPLTFPIPEAYFSISNGAIQPFIIGEAEITDIRDTFKPYVKIEPSTDVRWTAKAEPTDATFAKCATVSSYLEDSTLVMTSPVQKFPSVTGPIDTDFWLVTHSQVDVPEGGEAIPLDEGLQLSYKDFFGVDSTIFISPITITATGAELLLAKHLVSVNGEPVKDSTFTLKEGSNTLIVAIDVYCHGNDLAKSPVLHHIIGCDVDLQKSTWTVKNVTQLPDGRKRLEWTLPDFIPGSSRRLLLTLNVPVFESQSNEPILICDSSMAYYENFVDTEARQIVYALDLYIAPEGEFTYSPANPTPGSEVTLSATFHRSGSAVAKNLLLRFFNGNPENNLNAISDVTIGRFAGKDTSVSITWRVPPAGDMVFEFFVGLDADTSIGELSEKNNIAKATMSAATSLMVTKLINYPNPFSDRTEFIFTLSQPAQVTIKIYSMEGRLIKTLDCGFCDIGYNSYEWDGADDDGDFLPNGTYIYRTIIKNDKGSIERREYLVKMK